MLKILEVFMIRSAPIIRRLCFSVLALLSAISAKSSDFGTTGLIAMPSARQMEDGELAATISSNQVANLFNISYKITPWLESTFRYSVFNPYDRSESRDRLRDRSYEVKARLLAESSLTPALALGIRDILGTGVWSGEYLVASKQWGAFDTTLGIGWGRFAERGSFSNPLRVLDERFASRPSRRSTGGQQGGEIRAKSFFRGDVGFFGGVEYQLPEAPSPLQ